MKKLFTPLIVLVLSASSLLAQPYWKNFTTSNGLPINKAFAIEADDSNRVWYGNNSGFGSDFHLVHYDKGLFTKDSVNGLVYGIKAHKDTLWVVTGENIQSYNNFQNWEVQDPVSSLGFISLGYSGPLVIDNDGNKWLKPDEGGLLRYNKGTWQLYKTTNSQLPVDKINSIHWFNDTLWLGTDSGLIKFKNNQWQIINSTNSNLPNDTVKVISDDNNRLCVITANSNFSIKVSTGNYVTYSNPILENAYAMEADGNDVMWIVTQPGITSLVGNQFTNYNTNNSDLVDDLVLSVTIDKNDHKWIGTFLGISVFKETPINLSTEEIIKSVGYTVYPNPATDYLKLHTDYSGSYEIFTVNGKKLEKGEVANNTINTQNLAKGTYILVLKGSNTVFSTRFVKQ